MKPAPQPTAASPIAQRSRGASRSAGGASSNVNTASRSASDAIPATIQNSGRHACASACAPPTNGPIATAPKTHMFMMTAVWRRRAFGKPMVSGGAAAISSMLVARPCMTCPPMNMPAFAADAANTEPTKSTTA